MVKGAADLVGKFGEAIITASEIKPIKMSDQDG